MPKSKAVVDTNVWISAFCNPLGTPRKIADHFEANNFILVCSNELLVELSAVFSRRKLTKRVRPQQSNQFIALLKQKATFVKLTDIPAISPDPKDDMFLACAAAANCDFLVTGNKKDLLDLHTYKKTKIITPAQFLKILEQTKA